MKRITARVRHGRRQQHISLPPSGLGGIDHGEEESGGLEVLRITVTGNRQKPSA